VLDHAPHPTVMPDAILRELPASGLVGSQGRPIEASLAPFYAEIARTAAELLHPGREE
jgi:hypothetical protein